ncbi:hypothetical protein ABVT39_023502 [Epinephelus coioides]
MAVMEVMTAETVMSDCIQEEVLTYISGWLIRQVKVDPMIYSCSRCEELLVHVNHADHSYAAAIGDSSTFLKRKRYTFEANLIEPSKVFQDTITKLEAKL